MRAAIQSGKQRIVEPRYAVPVADEDAVEIERRPIDARKVDIGSEARLCAGRRTVERRQLFCGGNCFKIVAVLYIAHIGQSVPLDYKVVSLGVIIVVPITVGSQRVVVLVAAAVVGFAACPMCVAERAAEYPLPVALLRLVRTAEVERAVVTLIFIYRIEESVFVFVCNGCKISAEIFGILFGVRPELRLGYERVVMVAVTVNLERYLFAVDIGESARVGHDYRPYIIPFANNVIIPVVAAVVPAVVRVRAVKFEEILAAAARLLSAPERIAERLSGNPLPFALFSLVGSAQPIVVVAGVLGRERYCYGILLALGCDSGKMTA